MQNIPASENKKPFSMAEFTLKLKQNLTKIIVISSLLVFLIIGLFLYFRLDESKKVAQNLNSNAQVLNSSTEKMNSVLTEISEINSQLNKDADFKEYLEKMNNQKKYLETTLNTELSDNQTKIKNGPNQDSKLFAQKANDTINLQKSSLVSLNLALNLTTCYAQKTLDLTQWASEKTKTWVELTSETSVADFTQLAKETADKMAESSSVIISYKDCFADKLEKYYTNDIKAESEIESKIYKELASSLNKLLTSLADKNKSDYDASNSQIISILKGDSKLQKYLKEAINKAVEDTIYSVNSKLKLQAQETNKTFSDVINMYTLNKTLKF